MATLEIKDLHVEVEDKDKKTRKKILKGVNLTLKTGEIHAIMGPNVQENLLCLKRLWAIHAITLLKVIFC